MIFFRNTISIRKRKKKKWMKKSEVEVCIIQPSSHLANRPPSTYIGYCNIGYTVATCPTCSIESVKEVDDRVLQVSTSSTCSSRNTPAFFMSISIINYINFLFILKYISYSLMVSVTVCFKSIPGSNPSGSKFFF